MNDNELVGLQDVPNFPWVTRTVTIEPLTHGYVVRIGCASFAVADDKEQSLDQMLKKIGDYFRNPKEVEEKYTETGEY